ncbi:T9SS type A sorting domain-containing protein [Hymenobacter terrigena]
MLLQPDGKVVVGGSDDFLNGVLTSKLRRLNADGSPDAAFLAQTGTGPDIGTVQALALQADGKIVAGVQSMTYYSGVPASGIVRLNADGSVDAAFNAGGLGLSTQPNASFNGNIRSLAVQADGKILVGTWPVSILSYYNGQVVGSLLRLNTDGSLDTGFNLGSGLTRTNAEPAVEAIVVQADGKILVGGRFDALNGTAVSNLVRLNANGSIDTGFAIGSGIGQVNDGVRALAQQADGKLLVGGGFHTFNGAPLDNLLRLNLNGTLDNTFQSPTDYPLVLHLRPQANGSILLAGNFRRYNGAVVGGVARLSSTGVLDASFVSGAGITTSYTYDFLPIANGQYLVGGGFTDYSGTPRTGLARLTSTAALDLTYNPVYGYKGSISAVGALPNGQLLVQGSFSSFNGTAAASGYGTPHLINANGTYSGPVPGTNTGIGTVLLLPNGQLYRLAPAPTGTVATLTRLLVDGTTDASFAPTTVSNSPDLVNLVLNSTSAGGLFLLGNFARVNGTARTGVARLLPDGNLDAGFAPAQPWGTTFNTLPAPTAASLPNNQALIGWTDTQSHLLRLTATGAPDPAFSIGTAAGAAGTFATVTQPDGRLLVTGSFTSFNGQAAPGLLRLLPTGAPDATFVPALSLDRLVVQPDGRILGTQNAHRPTNQLRRLNADGSLDASFAAVPIPEPPYYHTGLLGYLLQPADGKILLYGDFTTVNGQSRTGLARLGNTLLANQPAFAAAPELEIFPNPAQQQATLRIPATAVAATAQPVLLLDMQGRTVRRFTLPARQSEATISLSDVASGVYLLQTTTSQGPVRQRVAVTR